MNLRILLTHRIWLFLLTALLTGGVAQAQGKKEERQAKQTEVLSLIQNRNFVFRAQSVIPQGGSFRYLTTDYDMKVSPNSLSTFLPYFGRAYNATLNSSGPGIEFTSREFDWEVKERKRGGWIIRIDPKDTRDVRQMTLTVSGSGAASLQVMSNNRQPISYDGFISAQKS